ncbi:hypothetical protein [Archangium violaceum]|uniref:hypothetical protein n=1 Tax=Archangium violaceum TaxID=83451 RepID=UPI0036DBB7A0
MAEDDVRNLVTSVQLPSLLRDVYEGKLRLPELPQESWGNTRRLKLFESIYRRLPTGGIVVWRTSQQMKCRGAIGPVTLREPAETRIRDYLMEGIGLVEALFQELGQVFWNEEDPARRQVSGSESPTAFVTFDLKTQTFRLSRPGDVLQSAECQMSRLLDATWQHAFSDALRSLPMGQQLQSRFSRLVDTFYEALVTVILVVADDTKDLQALLALRGTALPLQLLERGPATLRWYCDTCGQSIRHSRDGWVEWLIRTEGSCRLGRGFRLVHHQPASPRPQGCQYDGDQEYQRDRSIVCDVALDDFLGHDGLTYLLEVLSRGELPQEQVVEMIKRLHTPGYERARFHVQSAAAEGVIEPNMATGFYSQGDITRVLDWADDEDRKP